LDLIGSSDRRDLYNGFGDGLARAFEFAVTPVIFGAMGYGLDRWLGIFPLLTITLLLFALTGQFVMMWIRYDAEMRAHEAGAVWNRRKTGRGGE
jgi:hypothetical protein